MTTEEVLKKAVEAHKAGRLQDAEALYRYILQKNPTHPDANHNLGVMAVSLNKTEIAIPFFKIALESNPNQGQFWLSYIDALIKDEQVENAQRLLEQGKKRGLSSKNIEELEGRLEVISLSKNLNSISINKTLNKVQELHKNFSSQSNKKKSPKLNDRKNPSQIELRSLLEHYEKGQYVFAHNLATTLTQTYPHHPFGWKVLGALLEQTGKLQESLNANQKVLEISPNDVEAHNNLANTLQELGRLEEAEAILKKAIAIQPGLAQAHFNLGNAIRGLGRLEEAQTCYKKAIAIKTNYAEAHYNLGISFQELGKFADAESSYKKAIAARPDYAEAHYNLGITFQALGRLEDAEKSYKKAIEVKPNYAEAHCNLGNILKELGKLELAEAHIKKAISSKPDYAEAHNNLGAMLRQLGRLAEAETSYKKAITFNPDLAEAYGNLGVTLQELGRLPDAEISYKNALAIKQDYAEAHCNLGITLRELGKLEGAETSYKKSISFKPDYAEAHFNLGVMLRELGRLTEAEASFAQAISLKPDLVKARNEMLNCLYLMDKKTLFFDELDYLIKQDKASSMVGSLTSRSALRYGEERSNIFCNKPLEHILLVDLKSRYNFEKIFVSNVNSILYENQRSRRKQNLLFNGSQTSGNLLDVGNNFTQEIQKIIRLEIERYRKNFESSEDGLIRKWQTDYSLNGWLISMNSGGELHPHIHNNGWLSGSIYINVPPKLNSDSGSLVVALGRDSDTTNSNLNSKKVLDVVTGNMVLFPASLMHYTIPFESKEDRIVLAFDVIFK